MKTLATVALTLICFLCHTSTVGARVVADVLRGGCCQAFSRHAVPKEKIKHVETTHSCRTKAILITTVCDKRLCVDPKWRWAQEALRQFHSSPAAFNASECTKRK